jgi:hypothetical protein
MAIQDGESVTVLAATHDRRCYHPATRRMPIPLLVLIIVIAFPVVVPIAIVLYLWDRRRMQVVAERTVVNVLAHR